MRLHIRIQRSIVLESCQYLRDYRSASSIASVSEGGLAVVAPPEILPLARHKRRHKLISKPASLLHQASLLKVEDDNICRGKLPSFACKLYMGLDASLPGRHADFRQDPDG